MTTAGRRARRSLLLSGVVAAVSVLAVGAVVGILGGGPAAAVTLAMAGTLLALGAAAGFGARARRASSVVLVAASDFAGLAVSVCIGLIVLLLVLGRLPVGAERTVVNPAFIAVLVVATLAGPVGRRAARSVRSALTGTRRSPDELLAEFAERAGCGAPVEDLLRRLAESMRRDWRLSSVQIWTAPAADPTAADASPTGLHRVLVAPRPDEPGAEPAPLDEAELATVRRAGVAGPGWLRLWLPRLLPADADRRQLRLAPAVHGGCVLALVVIERAADADSFGDADERALAEIVRRLASVLRNRALDEALQATLADLRRSNTELQASRGRLVAAADAERRRIERNLHDGAQQHLVALAVGLRLVRDGLGDGAEQNRELIDELDRGVRESIDALRDLAHGIYPPLLRDAGLAEALRAAARRSPLHVTVRAKGGGRHPEAVEAAVYFCCLEALQNAAKHAGGSAVVLSLDEVGGELVFEVTDDGPGFDVASTAAGSGLQNMADRLGAIGGRVRWHSVSGTGTSVSGRVPVGTRAAAAAIGPAGEPSDPTPPPGSAHAPASDGGPSRPGSAHAPASDPPVPV